MNQQLLDELKQKLLAAKKETEKDLSIVSDKDTGDHVPGKHAAKFPNYGDDHDDELLENSPTEVTDYMVNVDSTGEIESRLNAINKALEKIESGTYGTCEQCNSSIDEERLKVQPSANICMNCAK